MQITTCAVESAQTHWQHSGNAACADFLTPEKLKEMDSILFFIASVGGGLCVFAGIFYLLIEADSRYDRYRDSKK